ncbi:hypothetical protein [Bartonella rattaustraliani]|uniref:hypothetical protein n=1 Tax=Bartonella rattaustraliani TaxID=481139 RepID=UPI00031EEF56|nr:hypothetical protein [Bartonella rattaustraliani]
MLETLLWGSFILRVVISCVALLIEHMEEEGIISAANHAGKREILVPAEEEAF